MFIVLKDMKRRDREIQAWLDEPNTKLLMPEGDVRTLNDGTTEELPPAYKNKNDGFRSIFDHILLTETTDQNISVKKKEWCKKLEGKLNNEVMSVKVAVKDDKVIAIEYNGKTYEPSNDTAPGNTPG